MATKARKRRTERPRMASITAAMFYSSRLGADEKARVLNMLPPIRQRMVTATHSYHDYVILCTANHRTVAAHDMRLVRAPAELLQAADDALRDIRQDCQGAGDTWTPRALRASEITAIDDLLAVYRAVVHEVTYGEWKRIEDLSLARVRASGGQLVDIPVPEAA